MTGLIIQWTSSSLEQMSFFLTPSISSAIHSASSQGFASFSYNLKLLKDVESSQVALKQNMLLIIKLNCFSPKETTMLAYLQV